MSIADYFNARRYLEDETEILGHRLDLARDRLKNSRGTWARNYWSQVLDSLIVQWRNSPSVNHGQSLNPGTARWQVSYDFFESHDGISQHDLSLRIFDRIFRTNLDDSWERERMRKLTGGY
jgi:hypothetical protein